jgi:hypothetical protein
LKEKREIYERQKKKKEKKKKIRNKIIKIRRKGA